MRNSLGGHHRRHTRQATGEPRQDNCRSDATARPTSRTWSWSRILLWKSAMRCPNCNEELLSEASLCRFCGKYVAQPEPPSLPATGSTQKLRPFVSCPKCSVGMELGFPVSPPQRSGVWWAAGEPPFDDLLRKIDGEPWRIYPLAFYRCPTCSYCEFYAPDR